MFEKLETLKDRLGELNEKMADPSVISNKTEFVKLSKEHNSLTPLIEAYDNYKSTCKALEDALCAIETEKDEEMAELLHAEIADLKQQKEEQEHALKVLLLPTDPNDSKNVIIEIRGGAGGEESMLFAQVLRRMYYMYADKHHLKVEENDIQETELGGLKEASFTIKGHNAYARFKYESGVHRVQRVPETESQGRIHTSTATVAVLPETENVEINIDEKDLKIDTYRSSGAGGQHINKTESAIRITHLPTNTVVTCQSERSQIQNRERAMMMLKSKLFDYYQTMADKEYADRRKLQVGTGDRSERIRTYNYPQGRVTDHRIGFTVYTLTEYLNGDIDNMIEALTLADQTAKLQNISEN